MTEQLEYWTQQWFAGVEALQTMLSPQDVIVLGVLLAFLVAAVIFGGVWLRRRRSLQVSATTELEGPPSSEPLPERQITAAEFLAQIQNDHAAPVHKTKMEPRIEAYEPPELTTAVSEPVEQAEPVVEAALSPAPEWQQELQGLRLELTALQDQVRMQSSALLLQSEAIRAMEAYMELLDNRQSVGAAADTAPVNDYDTAISLAAKGVDSDTLMARTGISATEAELILRLHGAAR